MLQLPELHVAGGSPVSAVENEGHRPLFEQITQRDVTTAGSGQCKARCYRAEFKRLRSQSTTTVGGAQYVQRRGAGGIGFVEGNGGALVGSR